MKRIKAIWEIGKTLLIVLLFALTVFMAVLYAYRSRFIRDTRTETLPPLSEVAKETGAHAGLVRSLLQPETIAVKTNTAHAYAITQGSRYLADMYDMLCPDLVVALGADSRCESAGDAVWEACLTAPSYLYVRYHTPLPSALLYWHALPPEATDHVRAAVMEGEAPFVYELFLFPENAATDAPFAVLRTAAGATYTCTVAEAPDDNVALKTSADFALYQEADALALADFAGETEDAPLSFLSSTVLYDGGLQSVKLVPESPHLTPEHRTALTSLFAINPDKTGHYEDSETQSTVYLATHGQLSISDTAITYTTEKKEAGGIPISHFLKYETNDGIYSPTEQLEAAERLIEELVSFDRTLFGREASLLLTNVSMEESTLWVECRYYYNNVPIADAPIACRLAITGDTLTSLTVSPFAVTLPAKLDARRCLPQAGTLALLFDRARAVPDAYDPSARYTMRYEYKADEDSLLCAEWRPVKIG